MMKVLIDQGVRFVLIGGLAARLHGSPTVTNDLDVCYARDSDNLIRLSAALSDMGATLRGVDEEVPFQLDEESLASGDHFTFSTNFGALDCLGVPAGIAGYESLEATATEMDLNGILVRVCSIDDLIRMKRAAGRPKDRVELEILGAVREEIDRASEAEV
jgi:hypothetical protein